MRDTFVRTLLEIAKKDKNVYIITGDLGFGVLKPFWTELPDQIINAGIAEQNMTSIAAGLAMQGKTVYTYSIGNFPTLRCIEQIRNDCAYHNANVKVVCVGGGFVLYFLRRRLRLRAKRWQRRLFRARGRRLRRRYFLTAYLLFVSTNNKIRERSGFIPLRFLLKIFR